MGSRTVSDRAFGVPRQSPPRRKGLVVMIDGDALGVSRRKSTLGVACQTMGVNPRDDGDQVAVLVPTWNIETWLAYLRGETVDEARRDYPRLEQPRECQSMARKLWDMCRAREPREPSPLSVRDACQEYTRLSVPLTS